VNNFEAFGKLWVVFTTAVASQSVLKLKRRSRRRKQSLEGPLRC
jgi:hypothetical protein